MNKSLAQPRMTVRWRRDFCFFWSWWTPSWHKGRGPYISIGIGFLRIHRGY